MAQVTVTEEAERCLVEIYTYIARDNKTAASHLLDGFYSKFAELREFPRLGYRYEKNTAEISVS